MALLPIFRLAGYFTEPRLSNAEIHATSGEPARIAGAVVDRGSIRIVTWNIERGVHFQRVAATLRSLEPDIVLLQEVDRFCGRSGGRDIARDLANALDMNWVSAGEFQEIGEARGAPAALTGQAILSRGAIDDAAVLAFSTQSSPWRWRWNPVQPRRGGRIALRARTAGLLVYNVHLESGGNDQRRASQLQEVIADQSREGDAYAVIAGDFNTAALRPFAELASSGFVDALGPVAGRRTSINHIRPIDWVFVKGPARSTGRVEPVTRISDHFPVLATISR